MMSHEEEGVRGFVTLFSLKQGGGGRFLEKKNCHNEKCVTVREGGGSAKF